MPKGKRKLESDFDLDYEPSEGSDYESDEESSARNKKAKRDSKSKAKPQPQPKSIPAESFAIVAKRLAQSQPSQVIPPPIPFGPPVPHPLETTVAQLAAEKDHALEAKKKLEKDLTQTRAERDGIVTKAARLHTQLFSATEELKTVKAELKSTKAQLSLAEAELKSAKAEKKELERYQALDPIMRLTDKLGASYAASSSRFHTNTASFTPQQFQAMLNAPAGDEVASDAPTQHASYNLPW